MTLVSHIVLRYIILALCAALISSPSLATTIYRWNDAKGNPVMSDRPPPPGTPYVKLDKGFGKPVKPPASPSTTTPPPVPTSQPVAAAPPAPVETFRIEKDPELCTQAKERIYSLETFARVRFTDASGESRIMTDEERAERLEQAREIEKIHCD